MSEIFRKKKQADPSAPNMHKPVKVVPSVFWLLYVAGALLIAAVIAWICLGWTIKTADIVGLYHPNSAAAGEVICFPPLSVAKTLQPGMECSAYLVNYNQQKYGHVKGTVEYVDPYVTSVNEMKALLGDDMLVNTFLQSGPVAAVVCKLQEDPETANGYYWSSEHGGEVELQDGTFMAVSVAISKERPIALGLPVLYELFT